MPLKSSTNAFWAEPMPSENSEIASAFCSRFFMVSPLLRLRFEHGRVDVDRRAHGRRNVDRTDVLAFGSRGLRLADGVDDRRGVVLELLGGKRQLADRD